MTLTDPTSLPHLPPEVVDVILDHLASHPRTLRRCSVVARAWLPRSRHHLFRRLSISTSQLYRFLARCELFGPAVVSLVFRASRRWHHVITALLCDRARCGSFLSYTSLTSLQLTGLHFPALDQLDQLIAAFPRLENIYLLDITWNKTQSTSALNYSAAFSRLRHLSLSARDLDPFLAWLGGQDLAVLESFSLTLLDGNSTAQILAFLSKRALRSVQIGPQGSQPCQQLVQQICEAHTLFPSSEVLLNDGRMSFFDLRPFLPLPPIRLKQFLDMSVHVVCQHRVALGFGSVHMELQLAQLDELLSCQRLAGIRRFLLFLDAEYDVAYISRQMPISTQRGVLVFWNLRSRSVGI